MKKDLRYLNKGFSGARGGQAGFIQNFIIPGIILIGIVIAGIAMLSSGSSTNTDNEKASMMANAVLAQSMSVTGAIQRAEADGAIPSATASTVVDISTATGVLLAGKYISSGAMPTPPVEASAAGTAWGYTKVAFVAKAAGSDIGSGTADDVLKLVLDGTSAEAVCLRINNKLYGTSTLAGTNPGTTAAGPTGAPVGGVEGCVKDAAVYSYYKVVNVK